jgi:hypothetical protein
MNLTPRDLMQASLACFGLAAAALHWAPELSAYLGLLGNGLLVAAAMPSAPRLVEVRASDTAVAEDRALVATISAHTSVLGSAVLGQMRLGTL